MNSSRRGFLYSLAASAASGLALSDALARVTPSTLDAGSTAEADGFIRLDRNESPHGPSAKVLAAIQTATGQSNRYPTTQIQALRETIAATHQVTQEQVILGCGSTEILRAAACAYLGKGKQLLQVSPTFGSLERYARAISSEVRSVRLTSAFAHDVPGMLAQVNPSTALVYVCNPNNPTASLTPRTDLEHFISELPASSIVVIDEAYHHFAGRSGTYTSFLERPVNDPRVVVTRTFSQAYGLAGLRLGYAVASPIVAQRLREFITEDNINSIVAAAAIAALNDVDWMRDVVQRNAAARQEFFNQAMARALKPIDSHANFVMMDTLHPADEVAARFYASKILIGPSFPPMRTHIRVSLGTQEEMLSFWRVWDSLPYPKHTMHH